MIDYPVKNGPKFCEFCGNNLKIQVRKIDRGYDIFTGAKNPAIEHTYLVCPQKHIEYLQVSDGRKWVRM